MNHRSSCIIIILLLGIAMALNQIPQTLSYQVIFSDATGNLLNGNYNLTFKIYNLQTGGTELWSEMQSTTFTEGMLNFTLGSITALNLTFD